MTDKLYFVADLKIEKALQRNFDAAALQLYRKLRKAGTTLDAHGAVVADHTKRKPKPR